jgi:hypothetical protein
MVDPVYYLYQATGVEFNGGINSARAKYHVSKHLRRCLTVYLRY